MSPSYAPGKVSRSPHTLTPVTSIFWPFSIQPTALEFLSWEISRHSMQRHRWQHGPTPCARWLTLVTPEVSCALFPMMLCCCWGQVCEPPRRTQHMFSLEPTDSEDWNSGLETPAEERLTQSYWPAEKRERCESGGHWYFERAVRCMRAWVGPQVKGLVPRGVPLSKGTYRAGGVTSTNEGK